MSFKFSSLFFFLFHIRSQFSPYSLMCISYFKLELLYFTNGFFSIYIISYIHVFKGLHSPPLQKNFIPEISKDVPVVKNNTKCFLLISDPLCHVSSLNYEFLHRSFTSWTFLFLVPSHFDLRSSLASLLTSNLLLSLLEIVMDQFLLFLIMTYGICCVFSPNREVTLIGRLQTQFSLNSQTNQYIMRQVFPSFWTETPCLPLRTQGVTSYDWYNFAAYPELPSFFSLLLSPYRWWYEQVPVPKVSFPQFHANTQEYDISFQTRPHMVSYQ